MPYKDSSENAKILVSQTTNDEIDAAHINYMSTTGKKISKREFVGIVIRAAVTNDHKILDLFRTEKIPA